MFNDKYQELIDEGEEFEKDIDECICDDIFFVPQSPRWDIVSKNAHSKKIGVVIDDAMYEIENQEGNKRLQGILPKF